VEQAAADTAPPHRSIGGKAGGVQRKITIRVRQARDLAMVFDAAESDFRRPSGAFGSKPV
jgi:hypothetical protein